MSTDTQVCQEVQVTISVIISRNDPNRGKIVQQIKVLRAAFGWGLKTAKDFSQHARAGLIQTITGPADEVDVFLGLIPGTGFSAQVESIG